MPPARPARSAPIGHLYPPRYPTTGRPIPSLWDRLRRPPAGAGREPAADTPSPRRTEVRSWAHHGTGNQAEGQGSPDLMVTAPTVLGTSPQIPVLGGECARQNRGHRGPIARDVTLKEARNIYSQQFKI